MANWRAEDLVIDRDFEADQECKNIIVYIETWFDVDRKFGTNISEHDDEWVNLYAALNPYSDELTMEYVICGSDHSESNVYCPTDEERDLIIEMIRETCQDVYGCDPIGFLDGLRTQEPYYNKPLANLQAVS